ncbi:MAG: hypothetical protein KJI69_06470 [Patescibacteria group bacterium]|nr:hypothetical protein [Patescibacteria group bacterium]
MSFLNTKNKELKVGEQYQYQSGRLTDFGEKVIQNVTLIEDNSTEERYVLKFQDDDTEEIFDVEMLKGSFYYGGMPRIWDKDEYC